MDNNVKEEWKAWCRLCAKVDVKNINIFSECAKPFNNIKINSIAAIKEYFHVQIFQEDDLPHVICTECLSMIDFLVKFNARVRKVQEMFSALQDHKKSGKMDLRLFSEKYVVPHEDSLKMHTLKVENEFQTATKAEKKIACDLHSSIDTKRSQTELVCAEQVEVLNTNLDTISICYDAFDKEIDFERCESPISAAIIEASDGGKTKASVIEIVKSRRKKHEKVVMGSKRGISEKCSSPPKKNHNKSKYVCRNCPQSFQRISSYRLHIRKAHSHIENIPLLEEKQMFTCPNCDQMFSRKGLMSRHVKSAHADKITFVCEECGDIMGSRTALRDHKFTHTNYAPFECKECGRRFKQETRLKKHMDIHGDKHICVECGLQLSSRATLYCHSLVHSDAMPHKCDYCGRAFKRSKTLKTHLILHTGLKPYSCDFCDKTFSNSTSCRTHKKNIHPREFAAQEASGLKPPKAKNIPNLAVLKAVTRTAKNLTPVAPKQSGNFSYGKKRKQDEKNSNLPSMQLNSKEEPTTSTVLNDNLTTIFDSI